MAVYTIEVENYTGRSQWGVNVPDGCCVVVCALEEIEKVNKRRRLQHAKIVKWVTDKYGDYLGAACIVYTLVAVIGKIDGLAGKDQWGVFYQLSGHEATGHCFWCGQAPIRGRYCSDAHLWMYKRHFNWSFARDWCWTRYASQCGLCGMKHTTKNPKEWRYRSLEVHHIEPLNAGFREWTLLNRPENLILLCPLCHDSTKKKDFVGIPKAKVNPNQLQFL